MVRAAVTFVLGLAAIWPVAAQKALFRSSVQTVVLHATVRGPDGRFAPNLTAADFEVRDEGRPVEISVFSNDPQPVTVALLLDMSGSMVGQFLRVREATKQFISALEDGDRVRIGTFGEEVALSPLLTGDKDALLRILRTELWPGGGTPLWNAVNAGMQSLNTETGRRVVLAVTDGVDSGNLPGLRRDAGDARKTMEDQGFVVYAIGLEGSRLDKGIITLAERSGGSHVMLEKGQDLVATFDRILDELRHQYEIGYALPTADGRLHDIEVRVRQPGMKVHARKHYRAPGSRQP